MFDPFGRLILPGMFVCKTGKSGPIIYQVYSLNYEKLTLRCIYSTVKHVYTNNHRSVTTKHNIGRTTLNVDSVIVCDMSHDPDFLQTWEKSLKLKGSTYDYINDHKYINCRFYLNKSKVDV